MHSPLSGGTGISGPSLSDGATSSWRALSPDHLQQQQQQQSQPQQPPMSPLQQQGPGSAAMSPLQHAAAQQQAAAAAAGSAGVSPMKPLGLPQHDDTIVYSALSRPLPDYALTHVFSQVAPGERPPPPLPPAPSAAHQAPGCSTGSPAGLKGCAAPPSLMHSFKGVCLFA